VVICLMASGGVGLHLMERIRGQKSSRRERFNGLHLICAAGCSTSGERNNQAGLAGTQI
jgi:hypothetical protein